jgi:hypothetical protein
MRKVIIDTNMLLVPGQHKVDIFSEIDRLLDEPYELVILKGSMDELDKILISGSGADKQAAKLAKMLIDHQQRRDFAATTSCKGLKITPSSPKVHVDDAIVEIAEDTLVATNDAGLKRRLLERGVRVISLRQQHLALSA